MTATIHGWCGQLDDPPKTPCPCRANTTTAAEVEARHQEAVQRAMHGRLPALQTMRTAPSLIAPHDPSGRGWAA